MKSAPSGLVALLGTGQFVFCDLYTFTLTTGQILRYTTSDVDISALDTSVSLLLHCDGSNGSTTFTDSSANAATVTVNGSAQITTSQSKFGGASGTFDGATGWLSVPDAPNLQFQGDFTVDLWMRPTNNTGGTVIGKTEQANFAPPAPAGDGQGPMEIFWDGSHARFYATSTALGNWDICFNVDMGACALNTWTHIAVTRSGNTYRTFNNGTLISTITSFLTPLGIPGGQIGIGHRGAFNPLLGLDLFTGFLDEIRVSDGVALWTQSFTPPTSAYPNVSRIIYSSALFFDQSGNKATGHWKTGLDTDTWQVYVMPVEFDPVTGTLNPILIGNTSWLQAVAAGALAGAQVDIHRAYWPSWQPWSSPKALYTDGSGTFLIKDYFAGRVAAVDVMRNQAVISVNSWLDQFKLMMPRNLWQALCRWTLFDAGCGIGQSTFLNTGSAQAGTTQSKIVTAGLAQPSGYFALGQVTMTSGLNAGFRRMIKSFDGTSMFLVAPFPFTVAPGDTFSAYPGCDKTLQTCTNKFANAANFGGEDLIPTPETAV